MLNETYSVIFQHCDIVLYPTVWSQSLGRSTSTSRPTYNTKFTFHLKGEDNFQILLLLFSTSLHFSLCKKSAETIITLKTRFKSTFWWWCCLLFFATLAAHDKRHFIAWGFASKSAYFPSSRIFLLLLPPGSHSSNCLKKQDNFYLLIFCFCK